MAQASTFPPGGHPSPGDPGPARLSPAPVTPRCPAVRASGLPEPQVGVAGPPPPAGPGSRRAPPLSGRVPCRSGPALAARLSPAPPAPAPAPLTILYAAPGLPWATASHTRRRYAQRQRFPPYVRNVPTAGGRGGAGSYDGG